MARSRFCNGHKRERRRTPFSGASCGVVFGALGEAGSGGKAGAGARDGRHVYGRKAGVQWHTTQVMNVRIGGSMVSDGGRAKVGQGASKKGAGAIIGRCAMPKAPAHR